MKLYPPFGQTIHYLTQTTHGESASNPNDLSKQKAEDWSAIVNTPIYAGCDGKIVNVSTSAGVYLTLDPGGWCPYWILYVHCKSIVALNTVVKRGQQIAVTTGSYGHLHLAFKNKNSTAPHPEPMDYFDRTVDIRTKYASIADLWFKNGVINWSLFNDFYIVDKLISINSLVEFTSGTNIRSEAGTNQADIGDITVGAVGRVISEPKYIDGYTWYLVEFSDMQGWCFDKHMVVVTKEITKTDGTVLDPCQLKIDQAVKLQKEEDDEFRQKEVLDTIRNQEIECENRLSLMKTDYIKETTLLNTVIEDYKMKVNDMEIKLKVLQEKLSEAQSKCDREKNEIRNNLFSRLSLREVINLLVSKLRKK